MSRQRAPASASGGSQTPRSYLGSSGRVDAASPSAGDSAGRREAPSRSAPSEKSGGFSLPSITANIDTFRIDEFILGEAIAGVAGGMGAR